MKFLVIRYSDKMPIARTATNHAKTPPRSHTAPLQKASVASLQSSIRRGKMSAEEMKAAQMKRREMLKKINRDKDALKQIRRLGRLLMVLLWCSVILATTGLAAAILVGEMCRFGYIPTQEEESQGILNPYSNPSVGCESAEGRAKVYSFQSAISFFTLLLVSANIGSNVVSFRQKELQLLYVAQSEDGDTGDMNLVTKQMRLQRWSKQMYFTLIELLLCSLPHPVPGYTSTFEVQAMDRTSIYQFESLIVIFMFGRLWHWWKLFKQSFFVNKFERTVFSLGNQRSIVNLFRERKLHTHKFAIKLLLQDYPGSTVFIIFNVFLLTCSYGIRVAESPLNPVQTTYFWNNLWLVIVTMTTVGYGDSVALSHFGRLVSVVVMAFGTLLVSLMTASATSNLTLSSKEARLLEAADADLVRADVVLACTKYLQYLWRMNHTHAKQDWREQDSLRRELWKALRNYRLAEQELGIYAEEHAAGIAPHHELGQGKKIAFEDEVSTSPTQFVRKVDTAWLQAHDHQGRPYHIPEGIPRQTQSRTENPLGIGLAEHMRAGDDAVKHCNDEKTADAERGETPWPDQGGESLNEWQQRIEQRLSLLQVGRQNIQGPWR